MLPFVLGNDRRDWVEIVTAREIGTDENRKVLAQELSLNIYRNTKFCPQKEKLRGKNEAWLVAWAELPPLSWMLTVTV